MPLFTIEHSRYAIALDFIFYAFSILGLAVVLWLICPVEQRFSACLLLIAGMIGASIMEYFLHRIILHKIRPFSIWHQRHHDKPRARIGTPTIGSALLILLIVFLPITLFGNILYAVALTLGVVLGYFHYILVHHAIHHWHGHSYWLMKRKRWHALHHSRSASNCFGVTSNIWDHLFCTVDKRGTSVVEK
ncbi:sterol desaturase family protein [Undibacterium sp. SXout7W]|uniref:sterol desaturase family protein n=1 Tax=Undibacterium sp. SXout7W TaxID=3413049 RepID=UPI003BF055C8